MSFYSAKLNAVGADQPTSWTINIGDELHDGMISSVIYCTEELNNDGRLAVIANAGGSQAPLGFRAPSNRFRRTMARSWSGSRATPAYSIRSLPPNIPMRWHAPANAHCTSNPQSPHH